MRAFIIWAIILGGLGYGGAKWHMHSKVGDAVDMAVMMMSPFATVTYDGVGSTMTGELTINGIRAHVSGFEDEIYIKKLGIDTPSFYHLIKLSDLGKFVQTRGGNLPSKIGIIAEGVRIPTNADYNRKLYNARLKELGITDAGEDANECAGKYGFSPKALAAMGYSEQVFSMSAHFKQEESTYSVIIKSDVDDMWALDAEMSLAGDMLTEVSKGTAYRPRLSSMRFEYEDRSLNERIKRYCGQRGLTPEQTTQAQIAAFQFMGKQNGIVFDEYVMDPYKEFLGGKDAIVITASPTEPVSLTQIKLYNPSDVPALLDLTAEVR